MRLAGIAYGHLKRGKARAALIVIGLALGVATAVALADVTGALERQLGEELDRHGANIVVAPKTEGLDVAYGGVTVSGVSYDLARLTTADLDAIRSIDYAERLAVVAPVLVGAADVEGRRAAVAGVDFAETGRLRSWWTVYGRMPSAPGEILVGREAAEALGIAQFGMGGGPGRVAARPAIDAESPAESAEQAPEWIPTAAIARDRVRIGDRELSVVGVLDATGSADDRLLFLDLEAAQTALGRPGELSLVEVSALCVDCPVEMMVRQISQVLPNAKVTAVQQAVAAKSMALERLARFGAALAGVVLVVAALLVFVTVTSSVSERRREIGVLRAVGFRRSHILKILGLETALLGLLGGAIGWGLGTLVAALAARYFTDGAIASVAPDYAAALLSVVGAIVVSALGALYPALQASKLDPTEALRHA